MRVGFASRAAGKTNRQRLQQMGVPRRFADCSTVDEMRALSPLPQDAHKFIDDAVNRVGRERLVVADALLQAGLVKPVPNPLGQTVIEWEDVSDTGGATRAMVPDPARGERGMPARTVNNIPFYVTYQNYSFNARVGAASEQTGMPLDTYQVENAVRRVNESIEDAVLNGAGLSVAGNSCPGLTTHPNVNTANFIDSEAWTASGHSGEDILTDVKSLVQVLHGDYKYGPYWLIVGTNYALKLDDDFKANSDITIRQRLSQLEYGGSNLRILTADRLPTNTVILMQATSDVIDLCVGVDPTPLSWEDPGGWRTHGMIFAMVVPRVKKDYNGNSGIVVGTPS